MKTRISYALPRLLAVGILLLAGHSAPAQIATTGTPSGAPPKSDIILKPVSEAPAESLSIAADRPGFSTPTGIVPLGHFQLEAGASAARSGGERDYSFGQLLVRVPVCSRAEVQLGVPSYLVARAGGQRVSGGDDTFVQAKIRLAAGPKAVYGLLLNSSLPTGSRTVAEHKYQPGAALAADYVLDATTGLTLNLGGSRASQSGQRFSQVYGAASLGFTLTPKTGAFAEAFAFNQPGGPTQKYADGGFTYLLNPRTQLDISSAIGLGNKAGGPDYSYGAGIARLF